MQLLTVVVALFWVFAFGLGWFCYRLAVQNGQLLLTIEGLGRAVQEYQFPPPPASSPPSEAGVQTGITPGTIGNDFDLPNLWGGRATLSDWLGREVLLVFVAPDCRPSRELLPRLAPLARGGSGDRPVMLIVSTGDAGDNRQLMEPLGIDAPVLLQEDWEVGDLYWVRSTPAAYLLDEGASIARALATGTASVLALAGATMPGSDPPFPATDVTQRQNRTSLGEASPLMAFQPGALAPVFSLPRLGGGESSLGDFAGRSLLLVFSDPLCSACDGIASKLQAVHVLPGAPDVLVVSRRDPETNRAQAQEGGQSYTILLQRNWELSRRFGILATPVAYLIDETGRIAEGPAVGAGAVEQLIHRSAVSL